MTDEPDACADCGAAHPSFPAPRDCEHVTKPQPCHRTALMPCPGHFESSSAHTLHAALHGQPGDGSFLAWISHVDNDGYAIGMFYTWMALLGRYALSEGTTAQQLLEAPVQLPEFGPDAPAYGPQVVQLLNFASRAAVTGDAETLRATLATVNELNNPAAVLSFLKSTAASTYVAVNSHPGCTVDMLSTFHMLGSQVNDQVGFAVLPHLVDMVTAMRAEDLPAAMAAFDAMTDLESPRTLVVAVDVVCRTLGQVIDEDLTVLAGEGGLGGGGQVSGVVDMATASPDNVTREVMAAVYALRTAQDYAAAASREDATHRLAAAAAAHPRGGTAFAVDVILAGAQLIASAIDQQEARVAANEQAPDGS